MIRTLFITMIIIIISSSFSKTVDPSHRILRDAQGRHIIYHGVNVVSKLPPYIPITEAFDPYFSLSVEDIKIMKDLGFNVVRLGIIWEAVEIEEDSYDQLYVEKVEKIIDALGSNGIYTLLDSHQDMFSRLFCGEGVPHFYAKKLTFNTKCNTSLLESFYGKIGVCLPLSHNNFRHDERGLPLVEDCKKGSFISYHQSPELASAYQSFYDNEYNIQEKFIEYWKFVLNHLKDNEYIIGIDFWNEPWSGNLWSSLRSFWPGWSTNNQVLPFYKKLSKEIRKIHPHFINMFEPVPFPDVLPFFGGIVAGGFHETPEEDGEFRHLQVLNAHSYCCQASAEICSKGEPHLDVAKTICKSFHSHKIHAHWKQAEKLNIGFILSEFGACKNTEACYEENKGVLDSCDLYLTSWMYWNYKPYGDHTTTGTEEEGLFNEDGTVQYYKEKSLARTYLQRAQGRILSMTFDDETSEFIGKVLLDTSIKAPSVLYLNERMFYKNGRNLILLNGKDDITDHAEITYKDHYYEFIFKEDKYNHKEVTVILVNSPVVHLTHLIKFKESQIKYNYFFEANNKNTLFIKTAKEFDENPLTIKIVTPSKTQFIPLNETFELENGYIQDMKIIVAPKHVHLSEEYSVIDIRHIKNTSITITLDQ